MAIETIYTCDRCGNKSSNLDGWIEFSAEGNCLSVQNNFANRQIHSMNNYECLHFCSGSCLIGQFVKTPFLKGRKIDVLLDGLKFIANQDLKGNWAVNRAKVALEEYQSQAENE